MVLSWLTGLPPALSTPLVAVAAVLAALLVYAVAWQVLRRLVRRSDTWLDDAVHRHARGPARLLLPALALQLVVPWLRAHVGAAPADAVSHALVVLWIGAVAWLLIRALAVVQDGVVRRYELDREDNLAARRVHTQFRVARRVAVVLIVLLAGAMMLMTFERFRELGAGLLASAGVAGLVIGLAAQRLLGNLLAGIQLAFTQPIRLDDVLVVEGEWGRVEEITLTYVVVRIWDQRRLVLPISYFLEKPFQNWTRVSADILGTVVLPLDYRVPVDELRDELRRICEASEEWDGEVCGVVVVDAGEHTMTVRALVGAPDSGQAWDLRCKVREGLLAYVREHHPEGLPRVRAEVGHRRSADGGAAGPDVSA